MTEASNLELTGPQGSIDYTTDDDVTPCTDKHEGRSSRKHKVQTEKTIVARRLEINHFQMEAPRTETPPGRQSEQRAEIARSEEFSRQKQQTKTQHQRSRSERRPTNDVTTTTKNVPASQKSSNGKVRLHTRSNDKSHASATSIKTSTETI